MERALKMNSNASGGIALIVVLVVLAFFAIIAVASRSSETEQSARPAHYPYRSYIERYGDPETRLDGIINLGNTMVRVRLLRYTPEGMLIVFTRAQSEGGSPRWVFNGYAAENGPNTPEVTSVTESLFAERMQERVNRIHGRSG
jgi:hypothetical protein